MPPHISAADFLKLRKEVVQLKTQLQLNQVIQRQQQLQLNQVIQRQQQQQLQLQQQLINKLQKPVYRASSTPFRRLHVTNPEESRINSEEELEAPMN